jgi:orotidine-5'-phosphate decarboxylase
MNSQPAERTLRDHLIVALDFQTQAEALRMVAAISGEINFFKIGLQLYTAAGPEIVRAVGASGAKVFLDLKLHDIPNTVASAVTAAGGLGVQMLTVHLAGGRAMLSAAVAAKARDLELLGVTVLTSADAATLREAGIEGSVEKQVERLADLGAATGINGLVASPHEIKMLRARFGDDIKIVTPGVRPSWFEPGDQKRFMTPREALQNGADYLVIGRPVTAHPNPRDAVRKILDEIHA